MRHWTREQSVRKALIDYDRFGSEPMELLLRSLRNTSRTSAQLRNDAGVREKKLISTQALSSIPKAPLSNPYPRVRGIKSYSLITVSEPRISNGRGDC